MSNKDIPTDELARFRRIVTNPDQHQDNPALIARAFHRLRMEHEVRRATVVPLRPQPWPLIPGGAA